MQRTLSGQFSRWNLNGHRRLFVDVVIPYEEARAFFTPVKFNALTGKGEQRDIADAHVRKLKREMEAGNFTPTAISVGLRKEHVVAMTLDDEGGTYELLMDDKKPLPLTDGGHRMQALSLILEDLQKKYDDAEEAEDEAAMDASGKLTEELLALPIGVRIYFDGSPQKDFVNLQSGRAVDKSHMLSLSLSQKLVDEPERKLAFDVAKVLSKRPGPFQNTIRFDSRGQAPIPISTLCSKTKSDLGTSLVGLSKLGLSFGQNDPEKLATVVLDAYKALEKNPGLLEGGQVLAPISNGGTKGTSTMLLGVATCLAYRRFGIGDTSEDSLNELRTAANQTLDQPVGGNLSGPRKRTLMGEFARCYFDGVEEGTHDGLPIPLLQELSTSTFAAESLPKAKPAASPKETKPKAPSKNATKATKSPKAAKNQEPALVGEATPIADLWEDSDSPWDAVA